MSRDGHNVIFFCLLVFLLLLPFIARCLQLVSLILLFRLWWSDTHRNSCILNIFIFFFGLRKFWISNFFLTWNWNCLLLLSFYKLNFWNLLKIRKKITNLLSYIFGGCCKFRDNFISGKIFYPNSFLANKWICILERNSLITQDWFPVAVARRCIVSYFYISIY